MNLTKEEAIALFREHWSWLAETGSLDKQAFIREKGHGKIKDDCYLCEYCGATYDEGTICSRCPIEWPHYLTGEPARCTDSYFDDWIEYVECGNVEERKRLAKIISELPEKEVKMRELIREKTLVDQLNSIHDRCVDGSDRSALTLAIEVITLCGHMPLQRIAEIGQADREGRLMIRE